MKNISWNLTEKDGKVKQSYSWEVHRKTEILISNQGIIKKREANIKTQDGN